MDIINHKNIPNFIILLKALLQCIKNTNEQSLNTKTKDEKTEFKKVVESYNNDIIPEDDNLLFLMLIFLFLNYIIFF